MNEITQANQIVESNFKTKQLWKIKVVLFFAVFLGLFSARADQMYDSQFVFLVSYTIYHDHSLNIRPYLDHDNLRASIYKLMPNNVFKKTVDGSEQWRYGYPNLPAILSIPFVYTADVLGFRFVGGDPPKWWLYNETILQKFYTSLLAGIIAIILFNLARLWLSTKMSALIVIVLIFGSSMSSVLTRALWTDVYANLFIFIALSHIVYGYKISKNFNLLLLITTLAFAVLCKLTYLVPAFFVVVLAFVVNRKKTLAIIFGGGLIVGCGLIYNLINQGNLFGIYNFASFDGFDFSRLAGLLISPARGVLIYWSWILFIVPLWFLVRTQLTNFEKIVVAVTAIQFGIFLILLSNFWFWHGGPGYGPRMFIPVMAWLFLVFIIVVSHFINLINSSSTNSANPQISPSLPAQFNVLIVVGFITCVLAIMLNMYGANQQKAHNLWYRQPLALGKTINDRMWDWQDPPFLAGIIHPENYYNFTIELTGDASAETPLPTVQDIKDAFRKSLQK